MKNSIKIDYLEFTLFRKNIHVALSDLGLNFYDFYKRQGRNGYKEGLIYNADSNFIVLYDGNEDMGVHFVFTGSAMDTFYQILSQRYEKDGNQLSLAWKDKLFYMRDFFVTMDNFGILKVSRLDIAFDDFYYFTPDEVGELWRSGVVKTRFRKHEITVSESRDSVSNLIVSDGVTHYFGSRHSDVFLRVYDKKAEQGVEDIDMWTRFEFQLADDNATAFLLVGLTRYFSNFDEYCKGLFYKHFDVCTDKFVTFLASTSCISIGMPARKKRTLLTVSCWEQKTIAPTIRSRVEKFGAEATAQYYMEIAANSKPRRDHVQLFSDI